MWGERLKELRLPPLCSREQMLDMLQSEEYGYLPPLPESIEFEVEKNIIPNFCAGKATLDKVKVKVVLYGEEFNFPVYATIPTAEGKHPYFVHINFRADVSDRYMPTEELVDRGFGVISLCYEDVTSDDGDMENGLAGLVGRHTERSATSPGKIALWAWAVQRANDYALTRPELDSRRAAVCGHSRLGKTALLAGATDERFAFVFSNDSGCSGAAITRQKVGESVADICKMFPYWFCESYYKYAGNEAKMPFDQHFLLACVYPRYVYVASASEDIWADPVSEFGCCVAVSEYYSRDGGVGFVAPDREPRVGDVFHGGHVGYHLRLGKHYFGREDWQHFADFICRHSGGDEAPLLRVAVELQSLSQAGLFYSKDVFDTERYTRIRELSAELLAQLSEEPPQKIKALFCNEEGYQTPKLDTRSAIFDDSGRILLVQERDGLWALPGGWVDVGLSIGENAVKEAYEEAGARVSPEFIIAVQDRDKHNPCAYAHKICKLFVMCKYIGGEFSPNSETLAAEYFAFDSLPPLAENKNTAEQIKMCFEAYARGAAPALFD